MTAPDHPRERFIAEISRPENEIDLIEAALLIAREHHADAEILACRKDLGRLSARAAEYMAATGPDAEGLCRFLAEREGFQGNTADYYNPDNSYLDRVLAARRGIPISLALIYLSVAADLDLAAVGIGFPGHFLVRVTAPGYPDGALVDPFEGRVLARDDCRKLLHASSGGTVAFSERLLAPVSKRDILRRMLGNLKMIYLQRQDFAETLSLCDRLLLIDPHSMQDRLDRALALEKLGYFALAADELSRLAQRPELLTQPQASAAVARKIATLRGVAPTSGRTLH